MALLSTDPLDVKLAGDQDLFVGPDGPEMISGIDGVAQLALIAVRLFQEEWFLNLDAGVPWYQEILGQKFDEQLTRLRLSEVVLRVPGVIRIISLEIDFDGSSRQMDVTMKLKTEFGDTQELEV
jgi:hypothetical protein